jgi:hypothetical protein
VACRIEKHVEFLVAQLLGGLDRDYERLDAGARLPDRAANLTGLAPECLWGRQGQHDLTGGRCLEATVAVSRANLDHNLATGDALRCLLAELALDRAAAAAARSASRPSRPAGP